jgi:hypothetical protein
MFICFTSRQETPLPGLGNQDIKVSNFLHPENYEVFAYANPIFLVERKHFFNYLYISDSFKDLPAYIRKSDKGPKEIVLWALRMKDLSLNASFEGGNGPFYINSKFQICGAVEENKTRGGSLFSNTDVDNLISRTANPINDLNDPRIMIEGRDFIKNFNV